MTLASSSPRTRRSTWTQGWNGDAEPCLKIYVAKNGDVTPYFKGRINGAMQSIKLDGDSLTDWRRQVRLLRGDSDAAEQAVTDKRTTVAKYIDTFIENQQQKIGHPNPKLRRSARSVELDEQRLNAFVKPKLGRKKLGEVKVKEIRSFVSGLYQLRKADGEPYSQNTLRDVVRVTGALFREAAKDGLIPRSPVRDLPSDERPSSQRAREQRYLDVDQVDLLLAEVGDTFRPALTVCAWAGLRISECLGIVWSDLDLDAGTLTVEMQLGRDGERVDTKTDNSRATLDLLPVVVETLKAHRREQAAKGLQFIGPDALVFQTITGQPQNARNVLRAVHRAGDKLGFNADGQAKVNVHSLRHSFVSNAVDAGLTIPEAALLARHDPQTTAAVYARVAETKRKQAASKLAVALGGAR